jgi:transcriptional regulator with XRE-family HTH domain
MKYVPGRLRILRIASGLSQAFVAKEVGVSTSMLRRYERGETRVPEDRQEQLAEFFGVCVPWLMGDDWQALDPSTLVDAVRTLRKQQDELAQLLMNVVDLLGAIQDGREQRRIDLPKMRHGVADTFRRKMAAREGALTLICGEVVA